MSVFSFAKIMVAPVFGPCVDDDELWKHNVDCKHDLPMSKDSTTQSYLDFDW